MQTESLIKLLTETLKFYAEEANYVNDQIKKDSGVQARHALKLVKDNEEAMKSYDKLFDDFVSESNEATTPEEIIDLVKKMKEDHGGKFI